MKRILDALRRVRGPRRRQRDLRGPHPRHRRSSRPSSAPPTACRAPTSARRASTGTSAATASRTSSYPELDFKVWTHPDGDSFARYWVRLQETRESARMVLQLLDGLPAGPIMAKVPRIIKVPEGEVWVETENPLGADGLLRRLEGRDRPVPGEDPLGVVQQRLDPALAAAGRVRSRRHHDPGVASTSSSGTSTGDALAARARRSAGAPPSRSRRSSSSAIMPARRADPRLRVPAQDDEPHAEPARSDGPRRLPRLVPARRRRHQVPPEGGHHAGARPTGASSRSRRSSS